MRQQAAREEMRLTSPGRQNFQSGSAPGCGGEPSPSAGRAETLMYPLPFKDWPPERPNPAWLALLGHPMPAGFLSPNASGPSITA